MSRDELVYSFDLGSGSVGVCVRKGENILRLNSLLIDSEFASVKDTAVRRRQIRTRIAHKERERWWGKQAKLAGIEVLSTAQPSKENPNLKPNKRMLIEFLPEDSEDKTIYSSHLLRIALLQGVKLEGWQVYKAVRSSLQRRGYDANLPWAANAKETRENKNNEHKKDDEEENVEASNRYDEKLKEIFDDKKEYYYPCYYEAFTQGIWSPENPKDLTRRLGTNPNPARNKANKPIENKCFPSRQLVEKELKALLAKAAELFPKLKGKEDLIIYGPTKEPYASYKNEKYAQYRGTAWDWQGLLGQKVPRFDNRIITKCRLMSRLNVCKANKQINKEVSFLLALKNMRYSKNNITTMQLNPEQIKNVFQSYIKYVESEKNKEQNTENARKMNEKNNPFKTTFWKERVEKLGGTVNPGQQEIPKPKDGGRSSFCKPALHVLHDLILSGKNPHDYYQEVTKSITNTDPNKWTVKDDYKFLLNMSNDWRSINVYDTREDDKKLSRSEAESKILKCISGISNRIVRHRLIMLFKILQDLRKKYGVPDKIVFEIAREDFAGEKKKKEYTNFSKDNKEKNNKVVKKLEDLGLNINKQNILKIRLGEEQGWKDVYDTSANRTLLPKNITDYEIDHIVPQAQGGSDSFLNFVLTKERFNKAKQDSTPYEWFQKTRKDDWETYVKNVREIYKNNGKKSNLLISDKASEYEKRKTDLNATMYIEKAAQKIVAFCFGFGINTAGDKKRIFFYTGEKVANVRSQLKLNELLYPSYEEYKKAQEAGLKEKNRKNKRHHALDALVLSVLPEIKTKVKNIENKPDYFNIKFCKKHLKTVIPETIKQLTPKQRETIYALRCRIENGQKRYYFVSRFGSSIDNFKLLDPEGKKNDNCARKNVGKIFDLKIKNDFEKKLNEKGLTQESWEKWLNKYTNNGKRIKKNAMIYSRDFDEKEIFSKDRKLKEVIGKYGNKGAMEGQWIREEKDHQGQIVYKDKNKWKVEPIRVFESMYEKHKDYKREFGDVKIFKSGQNVKLKNTSKNVPAGIYKLRSLATDGRCKLENIDNQETLTKDINFFIENCDMELYVKP